MSEWNEGMAEVCVIAGFRRGVRSSLFGGVTDVSVQPVGPIFKCQAVQEEEVSVATNIR